MKPKSRAPYRKIYRDAEPSSSAELTARRVNFLLKQKKQSHLTETLGALADKDSSISAELANRAGRLFKLFFKTKIAGEEANVKELLKTYLNARFFGLGLAEVYYENTKIRFADIALQKFFFEDEELYLKSGETKITPTPPKFFKLELPPVLLGLLWITYAKHLVLAHYVKFTQILSVPPIIYRTDDAENVDEIATTLKSLKSGSFGIFSKSDLIDVLSGRGTSADFLEFTRYCDAEIAKLINGSSLASNSGDKGSYAQSKTHENTSFDITVLDATEAAKAINQIYADLGLDLGLEFFIERDKNLLERAQTLKILHEMGWTLDKEQIAKEFDLPLIKSAARVPDLQANAKQAPRSLPLDAIDKEVEQRSAAGDDADVRFVADLLERAGSYEQALKLLQDLPDLLHLEKILADLLANANIKERANV